MKKLFLTSAVCAALHSATANAEDKIPEIVVSAKNNQSIDQLINSAIIFDLEDIEATQADDIPALLDAVAGVNFTDSGGRGSATSVFVRGVANSQIIVLIDGVRVGSATLGAAALNSYPIEAIDRVEIIKGPYSGIYGADAVGGVIQLFTKKSAEGIGSVSVTIGDDSLQELSLALHTSGENYSVHVAAQTEETDGIDRTSIVTDGNDDIDGFEEDAFSLGAEVNFSDNTKASLNILSSDNTVEFDNTFGSDPGLMTENETFSSAINVSHNFSDSLRWSTTLGINEDESETNGAFPSVFITDRNSIGTELGLSISSKSSLTLGLDYYEEDIESSNDFPITDRDNSGAFAQFSHHSDIFSVIGSLRFDDNSAYGSDTNVALAGAVDLSETLRLSASYGTAFVAPSFNFLFFPFFGNPDLVPEESESFELSLDGSSGGFDWRVSAYRTDIDNLFSFDPETFLAENIGEAEIEGIEFSLTKTWADWAFSFNADFLSATDLDSGIELDGRPEQTLRLIARRDWGNYSIRFDVKNESDRFDNSGTQLASYTLFDVGATYSFSETVKLSANIDNLFDEDFTLNLIGVSDRFNTEGRQAKVSLRVNF